MQNQYHEGVLTGKRRLGRFPMEKLKQVEQPTNQITDNIQRFDERENSFSRAFRGDFGPVAVREATRFVTLLHKVAFFYLRDKKVPLLLNGSIPNLQA